MADKNLQVVLAKRPVGWVDESDFRLVETSIPQPAEGQILVRTLWLSLDPYMRGRMNDVKSYVAKVEIGDPMVGGTVGEVVQSRNSRFKVGDIVVGGNGWQLYALSDGSGIRKVERGLLPLSAYLGVLGMPGVTAWIGLLEFGRPKPGETVVVSAASGAVGSVVGQIARLKGARAVGIAGGEAKCAYVTGELGFDACVDYKGGRLHEDLKAATPDGIDVYFENVGGEVLDAVLRRLNPFARIPLCGLVSQYNAVEPQGMRNLASLLVNRVSLRGFIVSDHRDRWPEALHQLGGWLADGSLKYRESIVDGLENAPRAFVGMLRGENFGKQLVRMS